MGGKEGDHQPDARVLRVNLFAVALHGFFLQMWELRLTELSHLPKITNYEHTKFCILFHNISIFTFIENCVLKDLILL